MTTILIPYLTNFEIQRYYHNGSRFNGAYSKNDLANTAKDRDM